MVSATAFQAEDVSSILITRSILRCVAVVASQSHKLKVVGSSPTIRNSIILHTEDCFIVLF